MYEYNHGGNAAFESGQAHLLDLSASINPLGLPKGVAEAISREIPNCVAYPDSLARALRAQIAAFESVNAEWIFCGSGASDIIFLLPRAVKAQKVLITAPTFSDYERAAQSFGAQIIRHPLMATDNFALNQSFLAAVAQEQPDLIFICNPNNPTGQLIEVALIEELLSHCQQLGALVVVDECFLDFAEQAGSYSSKMFVKKHPNVVILKAFTKLFSLPGIRLGYALCSDTSLLDSLYFHGADWPVSNLAGVAGIAALADAESFVKKTVSYVSEQRLIIESALIKWGFKVFPAAANYVFLHNPYPFNLQAELDKRGIRIRACGNFKGLDNSYFRIAVATAANNCQLLTAIEQIINDNHLL